MAELKTLADKIGALFTTRSKRFSLGAIVVKVFVIAGSAIAVIAQFASAPESGVTGWQIAGIASAILVGLGGLFLLSIDRDAADELEAARQGLEAAREAQSEIEEVVYDLDRYEAKQIQAVELYAALRSMRDVIERAVTTPNTSETTIIDTLVTAAKRSILIALGFKQEDRWTVGVYKAEDNGASLRCIGHCRSIECSLKRARIWPSGVGVGGISFANRREVIVPDMLSPGLGTTYDLGRLAREHDADRYRSVVSVPVLVGQDDKPWGIVVATTDRPQHFSNEHAPGIDNAEAVRALAGMVALAVSVANHHSRGTVADTDRASKTRPVLVQKKLGEGQP